MYHDESLLTHVQSSLLGYHEAKGEINRVISSDYDDISHYIRFDELLQKLADKSVSYEGKKDSLRAFLNTKNIYLWYYHNFRNSAGIPRLGKPLEEVLPFNNKEYTPHIKAYLRWLEQLPDHVFTNRNLALSENAVGNEEILLDSLIKELQSDQTQLGFKKAIKAFHRTNRSLKKYVNDLLEYKANLLLIRLDIGFNKIYLDQSRNSLGDDLLKSLAEVDPKDITDKTPNFKDQYVEALNTQLEADLKSIKAYRAKFFRLLKSKYAIEGFIWKLEFGADKSFHYHCLFLLNGDKHREDISIAKDMGEMWKQLTVNEDGETTKGIYWNCNAHKEKYKYLAIGHLHANNTDMKNNLFKYVLTYLAKTDYYIKLARTNDRTIGMGNDKEKIKSGRPRKAKVQKIS